MPDWCPSRMHCLILVDLQNDFMPGGALAVPDGDAVVAVANRLCRRFDLVVASQDWHPPDHMSFASQHAGRNPGEVVDLHGLDQVLWPDHCIQGSRGAAFHDSLDQRRLSSVFQKGTDRHLDSYSTFFDNARRKSTGLGEHLEAQGIKSVCLLGLATDYCVKFSALDAVSLGFRTRVVREGCRGIDLAEGDVERAWSEMKSAGIEIVSEHSLA